MGAMKYINTQVSFLPPELLGHPVYATELSSMASSIFCILLYLGIICGQHIGVDAWSPPKDGPYVKPAPNVALDGITSQSSTIAYYGNSRHANDGSLANNYLRSQCSYTKKEADPWWMVDLQKPYQILSVAVTNRVLECCKERLFNAEIHIGNDPEQGGKLNPRCGVISSIESGETLSFSCQGMVGQYVTITLPGKEEHLILCEVQVFGLPVSSSDDVEVTAPKYLTTPNGAPNLAVKGIAQQSSLYNMYGEPKNANDGSLASNYFFLECASTSEQEDPWWMVDLKASHRVYTVAVTNRGDCCAEKINNAEIRIGDSNDAGGKQNPVCGIIKSMANGETLSFECNGMQGQYVTVFIPGNKTSLTICEVQVFGLSSEAPDYTGIYVVSKADDSFHLADIFQNFFGLWSSDEEYDYDLPTVATRTDENLAFRGISSQSSTYDNLGKAENAIDGSTSTKYMSTHCSHTDLDIEPWWKVDLINTYNVTEVQITNRGDCCNNRINGAEIRIGTAPEKGGTKNPRCAKIATMALGESATFSCGMVGRYVTVTIPGRAAYLTLCEVKAFGHEISGNYTNNPSSPDSEEIEEQQAATELRNILKHSDAASNVALHGAAYQSSTAGEANAKNAVDGKLQNQNPDKQCAQTTVETDPWWTVDLTSIHKVFSIAVTNRGDCCSEGLDGAEIHLGDSAFSWKKNPVCGTVSKIGPGETFSFECNGMEGRYVTIVLLGNEKSLTLCEVQVFGLTVETPNGERNGDFEQQKENHGAKNVAPQGIPYQSSYYGQKEQAKRVIDGSLASNYMEGDCCHTEKQMHPWWQLDMKSKMRVHSVAITNRGDCCRERINGAEIRIGNSKKEGGLNSTRCGVVFKMNYEETLSFNCKELEGRYVTVTIPDRIEYLTLCEVQVFADPLEDGTEASDSSESVDGTEAPASPESDVELPIASGMNVDLTNKSFMFPKESDINHVKLLPEKAMSLKAFTLCMKVLLNVPENRETILFSYRTMFYDELNLWIERDGRIGLYMSGDGIIFPRMKFKSEWNHLCLTWESKYGRTEFWLNGRRSATKVYHQKNTVRSGGIVLLGQDQDSYGGDFDKTQSFVGQIKDLKMWNKVLPLRSLKSLFKGREIGNGNIFDWSSLSYSMIGNVAEV
ncbi:pentraxin fusion protein isoform X2 [Xenopus laevis]|uniref:Pentraxin fusion protein isoform X2 n=1 Tax=Xenopus laevis TaxID=8355 RepID=A0A8J1MZ50_XENLA|nr:pentraxin fusion protein isoform X2 [Xenopus laevis]